jgi:hypothetical protein
VFPNPANSSAERRTQPPKHRLRFSLGFVHRARFVTIVTATSLLSSLTHAQSLPWEYQPYRIRTIIALDVPGGVAQQLTVELPTYLNRRVVAAIGPIWTFDVEIATGAVRGRVLSDSHPSPPGRGQVARDSPRRGEGASEDPPADIPWAAVDKLVLLAVTWSPDGYSIIAREYDTLVQRWSTPIRREVRQPNSLPEQVFAALCQTVAPVAQFELVADDEKHVVLKPRGAALMRPATEEPWAKPGDVFLPILRRTSRGGQLVENGIQAVPWTFVEVVDNKDEKNPQTTARIHSGTRRPFGTRRQGRVEQVALALRADPADTVLRLRSRVSEDKPLVGYEIFAQTDPEKPDALIRLGATGRDGKLDVSAADQRVRTLLIKNGGQLLARLPVVPGAQPQLDIPLPDDDARLAAESLLSAMREDLIVVVARRNILMARTRQKIKSKDFDAAQKLILEINQLPGRAKFTTEITNAKRRTRSDDPRIQRRIDQLFEGTQAALTQYLDTRPINELTDELRDAQQNTGEKKGG